MSIDLAKNEVRVAWRYKFAQEKVFRALAAGRLLMTCGPRMDAFRHDFRVGGKYQFSWGTGGPNNCSSGEYLEIVPNERVRFTWCDVMAADAPPSIVTVTLTTRGAFTYVDLIHERTPNAERSHSYHQGWTEVLALFNDEMDGTTIRVAHDFDAPVARVHQALAKGLLFRFTTSGEADFKRGTLEFRVGGEYHFPNGAADYVRGKFTKIEPNEIRLTWSTIDHGVKVEDTDVAIFLEERPGQRTRLHLTHDGLAPLNVSESHVQGWLDALKNLAGVVR